MTDYDNSTSPSLTASSCTFSYNKNSSSTDYGGAVLVTNCSGTVSFSGCTFTGNNATSTMGGALAVSGEKTTSVSLSDCTFTSNAANTYGKDIIVTAGAQVSLASVTCESDDTAKRGNIATIGASIVQVTDYGCSLGNIMGYTDSNGTTTAGSTSDYGYLLYTGVAFSQNIGTIPSAPAMYFLSTSPSAANSFKIILTLPSSNYSFTQQSDTVTVGNTSYYVYALTESSN